VLLDEVEKADPEVMNLFYQVFDKGNLSDGEGRVVDFKNTLVMMGSNLASDLIMQACEADELPTSDALTETIRPVLQKYFKPALLGRMTVVPFYSLGPEVMRMIAQMKLNKIGNLLAESQDMAFEVRPEARDLLAERCTDSESGARNVDRIIDQSILPRVSQHLLQHMAEGDLPAKLVLGVDEQNEFTFTFANE
jgi:type VI secretion system protein VasG